MSYNEKCPICQEEVDRIYYDDAKDLTTCECKFCGKYKFYGTLREGVAGNMMKELTSFQRVSIAHKLKDLTQSDKEITLKSNVLEEMIESSEEIQKSTQINNIIQYIGNEVKKTGKPIDRPPKNFYFIVGSPNIKSAGVLLHQLKEDRGLILYEGVLGHNYGATDLDLTLDGWEIYESNRNSVS